MTAPLLTAKLLQQKVQAFQTVVPTFQGGPVLTDPALARLRHLRADHAADHFDASAEYPDFLAGEWAYLGPKYHHFGHIMAEMVHRIVPAKKAFRAERFLMVASKHDSALGFADLGQSYQEILAYCDIRPEMLRIICRNTIVESLLVCEQGTSISGPPSPYYLDLLREFSTRRLNELHGPATDLGKVYVSRSRIGHGGGLLGEHYIETLLEKEGWTIFHPEEHSFTSQMQTYRSASTLVFAEGSACHGTELLGREMMNDVYILIRRQNALSAYRNVLEPRARSFSGFRDTYFLGSAVQLQSTGALLDEYGMSLIDIERLGNFFRDRGLAGLPSLNLEDYLSAAEEGLKAYIGFHSPVDAPKGILLADAWRVAEFRLRFEQHKQALLLRGRRDRRNTVAVPDVLLDETDDATTIEQHAWAVHQAHDWSAAEHAWQRYRHRFLEDVNGYVYGTVALIKVGKVVVAGQLLDHALETLFPQRLDLLVARAIAAIFEGNRENGQQLWSDLATRQPASMASARAIAARILVNFHDPEDLDSLFAARLMNFEDDPALVTEMGWAACRRQDWTAARVHWKRYIEHYPDRMLGYSLLTTTMINLGELAVAEQVSNAGLSRLPDDPELLEKHAYVAQLAERWDEALQRWDKVISVKPGHDGLQATRDAVFRRVQLEARSASLRAGQAETLKIPEPAPQTGTVPLSVQSQDRP